MKVIDRTEAVTQHFWRNYFNKFKYEQKMETLKNENRSF